VEWQRPQLCASKTLRPEANSGGTSRLGAPTFPVTGAPSGGPEGSGLLLELQPIQSTAKVRPISDGNASRGSDICILSIVAG